MSRKIHTILSQHLLRLGLNSQYSSASPKNCNENNEHWKQPCLKDLQSDPGPASSSEERHWRLILDGTF